MRDKAGALAIAGVVALVFLGTLAALYFFSDAQPPQMKPTSTGPGRVMGIMIIFGVALCAWGLFLYMRCSDSFIRRYLVGVTGLLISWFLVVMLKYPSENDLFASLCWYYFYLPMIFIPTLLLLCGIRAATGDPGKFLRAVKIGVVSVSTVSCLLVFTNNIHHLAFVFDFADKSWSQNYSYGPVYWIVLAWVVLQLCAFYLTLFFAARKQLKSALLPLVVLGCLGLIYCVLYVLRIDVIFRSNLALTYALLAVVVIELCLDLGIFPSYLYYGKIFRKLPFDLKVSEQDGRVVYQTDKARSLLPSVAHRLSQTNLADKGVVRFLMPDDLNTVYKAYRVPGATALLTEDISEINALRQDLEQRQRRLLRQNELLERQREISRLIYRQEAEQEVYDHLSATLSLSIARITSAMNSATMEKFSQSAAERAKLFMKVKLLVAYCKRKGGLALLSIDEPMIDAGYVALIADEVCADARSVGIECEVLINTDEPLASSVFGKIYDCICEVAICAVFLESPIMIAGIKNDHDGFSVLRIALESKSGNDAVSAIAAEVTQTLNTQHIDHELSVSDSTLHLKFVEREG